MRWLVVTMIVALAGGVAHAQDKTGDPLDLAMQACLDGPTGQTTQGMVDCQATAIAGWDKRLNQVYQKAIKTLDPKSTELLRASQRQWVAFRDAEQTALGGPWREDRGTIIRVETVGVMLSALKERVAELQIYVGDEN